MHSISNHGFSVYGLFLDSSNLVLAELVHDNLKTVKSIFINRNSEKKDFWLISKKLIIDYNFSAIYVRYDYCFDDLFFYNFIKNTANICKVILEFPTYPYDSHFPSYNINLERSRRKSILEEIYCITSPSLVDSIDDINVLNFNNGYFNINNPYKFTNTPLINDINIQFVMSANFSIWHGVERFFYSLDSFLKYNSKCSIKVLLIGESPYKTFLQNLAIELKLNQYVTFLGFKTTTNFHFITKILHVV